MLSSNTVVAAKDFVQKEKETNSFQLFRSYAWYLLHSSEAFELPVPLEEIRKRHGFQRREDTLAQRGFLFGNTIFVNIDDALSVRRFTEAHEFMEALFMAIKNEDPCRFPKESSKDVWPDKERWCECGAAELLMPMRLFSPLVQEKGVSLFSARELARLCQTSLTATVRRMLEADVGRWVFMLLRQGYKKSQEVPSRDGQLVLWGDPKDWDPPAELRVWRSWRSPRVTEYICNNESLSRDTLIYQTLKSQLGEINQGKEQLDMEYIKGCCYTESLRVIIDDTSVVMALVHLGEKR